MEMKFLNDYNIWKISLHESTDTENKNTSPNAKPDPGDEKLINFAQNTKIIIIRNISVYERVVKTIIYQTPYSYKFVKRGGNDDINNQNVMKKGENIESLDVTKDSERLEYSFRMIQADVNQALANKEIEKNGITCASNIRIEDINAQKCIVFDYVFTDEDSIDKEGNKMKGKMEKKLGGIVEEIPPQIVESEKIKVAVNLNVDKIESVAGESSSLAMLNKVRRLLESGFERVAGTYSFQTRKRVVYVDADRLGEYLKSSSNRNSTLATDKLYRKYGVSMASKEQDVSVIEHNLDVSVEATDTVFYSKIKIGKYGK